MGFDYGTTKMGIAVGQSLTGTATPIAVIRARDGIPDWDAIDALVREWSPRQFVVGLPINMDGSMSDMARAAAKFGRRLTGRYHLPHELADERLSSFEAREFGDDDNIDAVAAKLILETWLAGQSDV